MNEDLKKMTEQVWNEISEKVSGEKKRNKFIRRECGGCGNIWCPHEWTPQEGVDILCLSVKDGYTYPVGDNSVTEKVETIALLHPDGDVAIATRTTGWHGGANSGGWYTTYELAG